jgi:putative ABC transport system permease protein
MSVGQLALAYLRKQWLMVVLNVLLLSLGLGLMVMSLLSVHQAETALTRDAQGIDLVVGAKGSPLQLILSGVYHLDLPTGNIRLDDAQTLTQNPVTGG